MILSIPLAWLQLKRERVRLLVALAGISFAVILMFMQLGFRDALFDSAVRFHQSLEGDIFLINPKSTALIAMARFPEERLYQARGFDGVETGSPIYLDFGLWRNPEQKERKTRGILVIGFDPSQQIFNYAQLTKNPKNPSPTEIEQVRQGFDRINLQDVVLFDRDSRAEFGRIACAYELYAKGQGEPITSENLLKTCKVKEEAELIRLKTEFFGSGPLQPLMTEVSDRRITVGGLITLGASFGADGNMITSDLNFLRIFSSRPKGSIDVGLIKVQPGKTGSEVLSQMRPPTEAIEKSPLRPLKQMIARFGGPPVPEPKVCFAGASPEDKQNWPRCLCPLVSTAATNNLSPLPKDVCVLSKAEFVAFEQYYWQTSTTIGFIFAFGTVMGFVVGTIIVYQILYTDVTDHLAEYATLKAMGYKNSYLLSVVFQEALILAILGFIPGVTASIFLYNTINSATNLPVAMTPGRALLVFSLAIVMCCISGTIAVRKVQSADPAEIF
ncbi:hypothetical protein BST81_21760 [Leptolyngbya sp. 'hensonii']|uniref:FtsX-like permease family protein n=1 Tax=Leptolyngbya sp. 'hensonii' TaxID=1922337 RepID=UPI00094F585A|nr:FtsX-like permease family protein [Leptolyngbya sp. 'hensonii']OLP16233.1 hypothetical protein BST81_21760 [Leptolyngbya sp. 'hensonii']